MTREQIEKAAGEYSGSVLGFKDNPVVMNKHKAFMDGAQWLINSAWHDASEEPEDEKFPILVEYSACGIDCFCFTVCDNELDYDMRRHLSYCTVLRWVYIDDLLPERKEESK